MRIITEDIYKRIDELKEDNFKLESGIWGLQTPYGEICITSSFLVLPPIEFKTSLRDSVILTYAKSPIHYSVIRKGNIFYVLLNYKKNNEKVSEVYAVIGDKAELTTEYPDFNKPDIKGTL